MSTFVVDSEHVEPCWHGELEHSSTSTSQLPPRATEQSSGYGATVTIELYQHTPFAYPAAQLQEYASTGTVTEVVESVQYAPF